MDLLDVEHACKPKKTAFSIFKYGQEKHNTNHNTCALYGVWRYQALCHAQQPTLESWPKLEMFSH